MRPDITQDTLARAIQRDWHDQHRYPEHRGWMRILERLTGMYGLLLWSHADEQVIGDCKTLMTIAINHNIMEYRNDQ